MSISQTNNNSLTIKLRNNEDKTIAPRTMSNDHLYISYFVYVWINTKIYKLKAGKEMDRDVTRIYIF